MKTVELNGRPVGPGHPCYIVAEIGINHNGDLDTAKKLIDVAVECGIDAVKFQKRTVDVVYSAEQLAMPRESPFGTTNGQLKYGLEFGQAEYEEIDAYCRQREIHWFASCWDEKSVDFIEQFKPPCQKVASARITHTSLLRYTALKGRPMLISTGASDDRIIESAVKAVDQDNLVLLHSVSTYPAKEKDLNLLAITTMTKTYYPIPIGYSGHEVGIFPTTFAAVLGACVLERHITLDRSMWGSDQAASVEPQGLKKIVECVRLWEVARGNGIKTPLPDEMAVMKKLGRMELV